MTVRELIDHLSCHNPDLIVLKEGEFLEEIETAMGWVRFFTEAESHRLGVAEYDEDGTCVIIL